MLDEKTLNLIKSGSLQTSTVDIRNKLNWRLQNGIVFYEYLKTGELIFKDGHAYEPTLKYEWFETDGKNIYFYPFNLKDNRGNSKYVLSLKKYKKYKEVYENLNLVSSNDVIISKKIIKQIKNLNVEIVKITPDNFNFYIRDILKMSQEWNKRWVERKNEFFKSKEDKDDLELDKEVKYTYLNIFKACKPNHVDWNVVLSKDGKLIGSGIDEIVGNKQRISISLESIENNIADLITTYMTKMSIQKYRILGGVDMSDDVEKNNYFFKKKYAIGSYIDYQYEF